MEIFKSIDKEYLNKDKEYLNKIMNNYFYIIYWNAYLYIYIYIYISIFSNIIKISGIPQYRLSNENKINFLIRSRKYKII